MPQLVFKKPLLAGALFLLALFTVSIGKVTAQNTSYEFAVLKYNAAAIGTLIQPLYPTSLTTAIGNWG